MKALLDRLKAAKHGSWEAAHADDDLSRLTANRILTISPHGTSLSHHEVWESMVPSPTS